MTAIARYLRAAREALGLTQRELPRALGCNVRSIVRLEAAEGIPSIELASAAVRELAARGADLEGSLLDGAWTLALQGGLDDADAAVLFTRAPGPVLRAGRVLLGLSQSELARAVSIAHTTIRKLESSDPSVSTDTACRYQEILGRKGVEMARADGRWLVRARR